MAILVFSKVNYCYDDEKHYKMHQTNRDRI